jgi:hypothetical protein
MIYGPDGGRWLPMKDCVWSSKVEFLPVFIISKHYEDRFDLFQRCLGIENATVDMVIDALNGLPSPRVEDLPTMRGMLIGLSQYSIGSTSFWDIKNKLDKSGCSKKPLIPVKLFRYG